MNDMSMNPAAIGVTAGFDIPDPTKIDRLEGKVSEAEWLIRKELAATYRLVALYGWTDLVFKREDDCFRVSWRTPVSERAGPGETD